MNVDQRAALFARVERLTEVPMLILSVVFLILVLLPEVVQLSQAAIEVLDGILWLTWGVFAVELVIKTYLAPQRRRYLIAHWADVLIVVLPFLRPLRLLRAFVGLIRVWKLAQAVLQQRTLSFIGVTSLITVILSAIVVCGHGQVPLPTRESLHCAIPGTQHCATIPCPLSGNFIRSILPQRFSLELSSYWLVRRH